MYKLLIVEDTLIIREELLEILTLEGYKVFQAENGKIGYEMALKHSPDLIISDLLMPELNGFEMFEKLQKNKETVNIPLIFMSSKSERQAISSGMNTGAEDYLVKPINIEELITVVGNKLKKKQPIKDNINKRVDESKFFLKESGRMSKIGYWTYDKQTGTGEWSAAVHKVFGSDPKKEMPELSVILNCFEEKSREKLIQAKEKLLSTGTDYDLELQLTNLRNEEHWILLIGEPIYNHENEIIGGKGIVRVITRLKNNSEELKRSNERYKFISLATNDAYWDWDLKKDEIYRSEEGFKKVFEFDESINIQKMKMDDYVHLDDRERIEQTLAETINNPNKNNFTFEYSFLSHRGNTLRIMDKGFIVRNKEGTALRIIGAATNITQQNNFKNSLKEAYSNLETILESTADGLLVIDTGDKVVRFNKKFKELWKIPDILLIEMNGKKVLDFILQQTVYPEKLQSYIEGLYNNPKDSGTSNIELKDGRVFERYSQPKMMNGKYTGRVWSCRDITERINDAKEKQQLFALVESSQELIGFGDLNGKPTFINKAGRKVLGIPEKKSLSNYHFSEFFPRDERRTVIGKFTSQFLVKGRWEGDTFLNNLETNEKMAVFMSAFVITDDNTGLPIGLGNVSIDNTNRIKIQNELIEAKEEAERLSGFKDQFLANMSHEIRTPLNGIIGFNKILLRSSLTEKQKEQLTAIKVSSDILLVVINDILDLSKIEAGKMILEKTELKIPHLINSLISTFELRLEEKKQTLQTHYDERIPDWVLGDPIRINQILLNLIANAIKFTNVGGAIRIRVNLLKEEGDTVIIEIKISDTGIGIPEDKIENIFDPFIQSNDNTFRKFGGSGLGLNIVKQLIDLMKGTISVKSELHIGSTFNLTIPLIKTENTTIKIEETVSNNNKLELLEQLKGLEKLKILIVDDMVINQLLAKTIIEGIGFETALAENGKVAIELLKKNTYDIILMDLQMPEMNGWEATYYIRNKMDTSKSSIPIIALTADVTQKSAAKCIEAGMDEYVSKPINETELLNKVIKLVTNKRNAINEKQQEATKICNLASLRKTLHNKPKLLKEMLEIILKELPVTMKQLAIAFENNDWKDLSLKIHSIKPTLILIGLPKEIISISKQIEENTKKEEHLDLLPAQFIKLEKALEKGCEELEEELNAIKN
jgi:PAS domain S-box-containing protein